ncbi:MAG: hypothetical protein U0797_14660 [Gemmataceae bacterium]
MAKGRVRSRMELREQYEAAEARERDARQEGDEGEGDEDEDVGDLEEEAAEAGGEEEEGAVKAKPKKKPAAKKAPAKPRKKVAKVVRKRVVWVVYDNSNKKIQQFDYIKKDEAVALAEKLKADKKQTYFVQPVKEEITE